MRLNDWHDRWRKRRADVGALGCLVLFFLCFFPHVLFGGRYIIAGDALYYSYPLRTVAWRMLRQGAWPLWTPHILSGYPLLSMAQLGLGYPLTWSYLLLRGAWAEQVYVLAPFLLAPMFTYAYLRELKRSRLAALLGALSFGYGGMMASPLANSGIIPNACMWLPLLLIALERARRAPFVTCLLAATLSYALSVLTGHGQSFLYVGVLAGAYALFLGLTTRGMKQESGGARYLSARHWRPALVACGAGLLAAGVAAFQILETARVARRSVRHTLSYELFTQGSFKPADLWHSFTTPLFYVIDMHAYVPPLALVLAIIAVYAEAGRKRERDPRVFFWCAVAVLACVLMMGQFTPVYRLVYHLPLLNLFRVPSRHTFEWTFAVGVLAAYGWDAMAVVLRRRRETQARARTSTLYAALALLAAAVAVGALWWLKAQTLQPSVNGSHTTIYSLWKGAFVLLTTLALWRASLVVTMRARRGVLIACVLVLCYVEPSLLIARWWGPATFTAAHYTTPSEATRYLQQFSSIEHRIYTRAYLMNEQFAVPPRFDGANLSALYGLNDVAGYEPLMLERYSHALGGAWLDAVHTLDHGTPDPTLFTARSHVLDILNTSFVVSYTNLEPTLGAPATPYSDAWQPVYEQRETLIMRNTRVLPRAWLVAEAEAVRSEEALARIRGESLRDFDPRRTALLEVPPHELPALPGGELAPGSTARIVTYEPTRLVIETGAPTATVLVASEIFYPGWEATVDGRPAPIYVADYLLRGMALPAGQHKVEMRYTAPAARSGALISGFTLLLLGVLFIYARRTRHVEQIQFEPPQAERVDEPPTMAPVAAMLEKLQRLPVPHLPRWLRECLIITLFLAMTALMTWPWVTRLRSAVSDPGDPYMIAWTLWSDYHQTFHDPLNLFHANIFYPYRYTLAFSEHDYGIALVFFPLFALGLRALTVHSVATFVGFAFCGYGAFRLVRTLSGSSSAGAIAGVIFAFIPFRFQLLSHLHYLFAGWIPLLLEALMLFVRVRSWRRAAWLGAAFLMNGLTCITWLILTIVPLALSAALLVVRHRVARERAFWVRGLLALAVASLLLLPFLWPYYKVSQLYGFKWPPEEAMRYSAHLVDWLSAEPRTKVWDGMGDGLPGVMNHLFPGLLPLLLPLAALLMVSANARRKPQQPADESSDGPHKRWLYGLDALCFAAGTCALIAAGLSHSQIGFFRGGTTDRALFIFTIALGVRLAISYPQLLRRGEGHNLIATLRSERHSDAYWLGLIWASAGFLGSFGMNFFLNRVLYDFFWPLRSLRVPARAAMLCYIGLAILAGVGASRLAQLVARWRPAIKPPVTYAVLVGALLFELHAAPLVFMRGAVDPDAVTLRLKATPMRGGVVELPAVPEQYSNQLYMLRAADHGRPLVNAASSFISPLTEKVYTMTEGPSIPKEFLDLLEGIPTSYVVFHHGHVTTEREEGFETFFADAVAQGRVRLIGRYGDADLYAVVKTEPEARPDARD